MTPQQAAVDTQVAFENRQQAERRITKAVVRLTQPHVQGVLIEVQGQFIDRIEVWPTGAALAVMSVEEQLKLPTYGAIRINPPLAEAYDVTVYTTAPDGLEINVALV